MDQDPAIEITPDTVWPVLERLPGREARVPVGALVEMVTGADSSLTAERAMRAAITALRMAGHPVCATPEDGYFRGIRADEIHQTVRQLTRRSLTGLTLASRMTGQSVQALAGQLALELEAADHE